MGHNCLQIIPCKGGNGSEIGLKLRRLLNITLYVALAVLSVMRVSAQSVDGDNASRYVFQLSQTVKTMGNYAVCFTVTMGEHKASGDYKVGADRYALCLGSIEAYGDAECRYEVDTSRREMVIDRVDKSSRNILSNPLSAFDFIGEEYIATMVSEDACRVVVKLTPRQNEGGVGVVEVTVDKRTTLPKRLVYKPSGESIRIDIDSIATIADAPEKFDASKYPNFEIIDFR